MASMKFKVITIDLKKGPDGAGMCSGSGSGTFLTNVLSAEGALYSWKVGFDNNDHHIKTVGASIDSVQINGTIVNVDGSLKLIDDSKNEISIDGSNLQVCVMAWVE